MNMKNISEILKKKKNKKKKAEKSGNDQCFPKCVRFLNVE